MRKWMRVLNAAAAALGLVAAGCALAASPVTLGVITIATGGWATYGKDNLAGTQLALKHINAAGGIQGRQVVLKIEDSASDPAQAVAMLHKLAGDSNVLGIIGPVASSELLAAESAALQRKVAILSTGSASLWKTPFNDWTFRMNLISVQAIPSVMKAMVKTKGWKSIAIVYDVENEYSNAEKGTVEKVARDLGLKVVASESMRLGDVDFSSHLSKIAPQKPDVIWLGATTNEAGLIIKQARERGLQSSFIGGAGLNDPTIFKLSNGKATDTYTFFGFDANDNRPIVKRFTEDFRKDNNKDPVAYNALGYDALMLYAAAIDKALKSGAQLTRQSIRDGFGSLANVEGVNGRYSYKNSGDNATPAFHVMSFDDKGKFQRVDIK